MPYERNWSVPATPPDIYAYLQNKFDSPSPDSVTIPTSKRNGTISIQKTNVLNPQDFKELLDGVSATLPELLKECHPKIQRQNIDIRWITGLDYEQMDDVVGINDGGAFIFFNKKSDKWCIGLNSIRYVKDKWSPRTAIFTILHEIAEEDYYIKAKFGEVDVKAEDLNNDLEAYNQLEDEVVANERATRILNRVYPS